MRKLGLCLLVLMALFVFGSVKTHAQCTTPVTFVCVGSGSCKPQPDTTACFMGNGMGDYVPAGQMRCCGQIVPNEYGCGVDGCLWAKNMTKTMRTTLAHLAVHNRVFLVACNGGLVPYQDSAAAEQARPTWSANQALSSDAGKVTTQTR